MALFDGIWVRYWWDVGNIWPVYGWYRIDNTTMYQWHIWFSKGQREVQLFQFNSIWSRRCVIKFPLIKIKNSLHYSTSTQGFGTLVYDTWDRIGHFRHKLIQNKLIWYSKSSKKLQKSFKNTFLTWNIFSGKFQRFPLKCSDLKIFDLDAITMAKLQH